MIDPLPLWDFTDPATSAERFLDTAEHADEPDKTAWLTQYARALGLQEKYDEATKVLDRLASDDAQAATYLALERGRLLRSSGHPEESRPLFVAAAALAETSGLQALHVDALHMIALAAPEDEQLRLNEEALAVARASTDQRRATGMPRCSTTSGWPTPTPVTSRRRWRRSRRRWPRGSGSATRAGPASPGG